MGNSISEITKRYQRDYLCDKDLCQAFGRFGEVLAGDTEDAIGRFQELWKGVKDYEDRGMLGDYLVEVHRESRDANVMGNALQGLFCLLSDNGDVSVGMRRFFTEELIEFLQDTEIDGSLRASSCVLIAGFGLKILNAGYWNGFKDFSNALKIYIMNSVWDLVDEMYKAGEYGYEIEESALKELNAQHRYVTLLSYVLKKRLEEGECDFIEKEFLRVVEFMTQDESIFHQAGVCKWLSVVNMFTVNNFFKTQREKDLFDTIVRGNREICEGESVNVYYREVAREVVDAQKLEYDLDIDELAREERELMEKRKEERGLVKKEKTMVELEEEILEFRGDCESEEAKGLLEQLEKANKFFLGERRDIRSSELYDRMLMLISMNGRIVKTDDVLDVFKDVAVDSQLGLFNEYGNAIKISFSAKKIPEEALDEDLDIDAIEDDCLIADEDEELVSSLMALST